MALDNITATEAEAVERVYPGLYQTKALQKVSAAIDQVNVNTTGIGALEAVAALVATKVLVLRTPVVQGASTMYLGVAPHAMQVTGVWSLASAKAGGGGIHTLTVQGANNTLLNAANVDLTTLVDATTKVWGLTATPANLILAAGDPITVEAASDNGAGIGCADLITALTYIDV